MSIKYNSSFLWVVPFISFGLGYLILYSTLQRKDLETPNVIGKDLQTGLSLLSEKGLSLRLVKEEESSEMTEGMILDQTPRPGVKVRPNQHVFVTVSRKPKVKQMPSFIGQTQKNIEAQVARLGLHPKFFFLKSSQPSGFCMAQYPACEQEMNGKKLLIYLASDEGKMAIMPNFKGCSISKIKELTNRYDLKIDIFHEHNVCQDHDCSNCRITDQRPLPGSLVDLGKKLYIQFQVETA